MTSPAASSASVRKALRRFRRDRRASSAIEFAVIAPIFLALLFATIETTLVFFAGQVLETGTLDSSRLIFTGTGGWTEAQFRNDFCPRVAALFNCANIDLDLRAYPPGTTITISDPLVGGAYVKNVAWQAAAPDNTVVVRAFYQWPLIVTGLGYNIVNITSGSKRLLAATTAFHVEPGAPGAPPGP